MPKGGGSGGLRSLLAAGGLEWALILVAAGLVVTMVAASPQGFTSDESWYLNQVGFVIQHGHGAAFLEHYRGSAGPLFVWFHAALLPLTSLDLPWVRMANVALWLLTAGTLAGCACLLGWSRREGRRAALAMLVFAPIWKCVGLAYTEMAAVAAAVLALAIMALGRPGRHARSMEGDSTRGRSYLGAGIVAVVAGSLISGAIMGRQPFLLLPLLVALIGLWAGPGWRYWLLVAGAAMPLPVTAFVIWGGLQPPAYVNQPLNPHDGLGFVVLSAFYAGAVSLLLRPDWLLAWGRRSWRASWPWWLLCAFLAGCYVGLIGAPPVGTRLQGLVQVWPWAELAIGMGVTVLGVATLVRLAWNVREAWQHPFTLLCVLAAGGFIASHLAIGPVFSNRYMAIAAPFLILAWGPDRRHGRYWAIGYLAAIAWGAFSLWGHLDGRQGPPFWDSEMEAFYPHLWEDVPGVFSDHQWQKFDYGNSPFLRDPLVGEPVLEPSGR